MDGIRFDYERRVDFDDDLQATTNHAESARENVKAIGKDLEMAFTPDKLADMIAGRKGLSGMEKVVTIGGGAIVDLVELGLLPLAAVKDAADAAIHGILSVFRKG